MNHRINNRSMYNIDEQGNLKFPLRSALLNAHNKPDSFWERQAAVFVIMSVCCTLDTVMFYQLFSSYMVDSDLVRLLSIIAMLIGFDLSPIILAIEVRKKSLGLNASKILICSLGIAFLTAFLWNIGLRIATRDLVLPDNTATISFIGTATAAETSHNELAMLNALFAASLPVITSLVSFGTSFFSYNPVKKRLHELRVEQVRLEDGIAELEALLLEYDSNPYNWDKMLEDDEQKYLTTLELIHEQTIYYCDYVRERIKEHLGDPAAYNELSKNRRPKLIKMFDDPAGDGNIRERKEA